MRLLRRRSQTLYADPGYQADGKPRYPLTSEGKVRAAWGYVNHVDNAARYTTEQLRLIHGRIQRAGRRYGIEFGHARSKERVTNRVMRRLGMR